MYPDERRSQYYAWGHATANNCTKAQGKRMLQKAWNSGLPLLFQHGKFDVDVAETHMGMRRLPWDRYHDTLYLLFLENPYAESLSLKPSAERLLGIKPTERDILREWLAANVPEVKRKPSSWGEHIPEAPGTLTGNYANGDVTRTAKLFTKLYKIIVARNMLSAYDRERKLMPILLKNERQGVRVNLRGLEHDYRVYTAALETADNWLRKRLRTKDMNVDSDEEVATALEKCRVVIEWIYTKTGKRSVAKGNLTLDMFRDARVASVFGYRNLLRTCLSMFFEPWLTMARATDGIVFTNWNQVRQSHDEHNTVGARTGRLSSNPNFQNIPKNWKKAIADGYVFPAFLGVPELPFMRSYFLPDDTDSLWGRRDYNQQELRLLGHYEDGDLMRRYNDDPRLDIHALVQAYIKEIVGLDLPRDPVKILNFADIYGRGLHTLAEKLNVDVATAKKLRRAKNSLLPGIDDLNRALKERGKAGLPIRTWGGREYYVEPEKYSKKYQRVMSFDYKLLNYLIQGSASDITKESIIRYHEHPKCGPTTGDARFLVTVHDENDISARKKAFKKEMLLLRDVMQSVEADVPMLSDGEQGPNWAKLKACD
jgi:DNA polymerase I-like protein with 3'-5' exonuclease and polymerase domains